MTVTGGFNDNSAGGGGPVSSTGFSSGGFPDAFAGNQGTMLINALKSLNFVTGVSGWQIERDGDAEFNNLTIRGTFMGTDFVINSLGAFFYNGTPANGNLIASIAAQSGSNDGEGNAYLAGIVSYDISAPGIYTQINVGEIILGFGSALGDICQIFSQLNGNLVLIAGLGGGLILPQLTLQPQSGNYPIVTTPFTKWDTGGGVAETWHDLRPLSTGWAGTISGEYPPQYRINSDGHVEFHGSVQLPASGSYNSVTWNSSTILPTAYRPNKPVSIPVALTGSQNLSTAVGVPRLYTDSTGVLQFISLPTSDNGAIVRLEGCHYALDQTGIIQS